MVINIGLNIAEENISEWKGVLYKMFKPKKRQIKGGKKLIRHTLDIVKIPKCVAYVIWNPK